MPLTAVPHVYRAFTNWLGDVPVSLSTTNPLPLLMDQPRAVEAAFYHPHFGVTVQNALSDSELLVARTRGTVSSDIGFTRTIDLADIDGDGVEDVIAGGLTNNALVWWKYDASSSTWLDHPVASSNDNPRSILGADIDQDGDVDILAALNAHDRIAWFENLGGGTNWAEHIFDTGVECAAVAFGDIDGDGDLDLMAAESSQHGVVVWENLGGAMSWSRRSVSAGFDRPYAIDAADVDGDGDLDIIAGSRSSDGVAWWRNDGTGNFGGENRVNRNLSAVYCVHAATWMLMEMSMLFQPIVPGIEYICG